MNNEEIEEAFEVILESIMNSNLKLYSKLELVINLRKFFENYTNNINLLRENDKKEVLKNEQIKI